MANITSKRQGEMIQTLFSVFKEVPEGLQAKDAIGQVHLLLERKLGRLS